MYCPKCSSQLPEGSKFCTTCGTPIASNTLGTWKCGNCESQVSREFYHCPHCGDSYEMSVEYLQAHPEVQPYEANLYEEDSLFKKIFSKIFIFVFMSAILIMCFFLLKYLMS